MVHSIHVPRFLETSAISKLLKLPKSAEHTYYNKRTHCKLTSKLSSYAASFRTNLYLDLSVVMMNMSIAIIPSKSSVMW